MPATLPSHLAFLHAGLSLKLSPSLHHSQMWQSLRLLLLRKKRRSWTLRQFLLVGYTQVLRTTADLLLCMVKLSLGVVRGR